MRAKTCTAICSFALTSLLLAPGPVWGQNRGVSHLVREINEALAANPTPSGSYQLSLDASGKFIAEKTDAEGVVARWEMYFEDLGSVVQTTSGQVYLKCSDAVGRCARQSCNGVFENFTGCVRGGETWRSHYSDALELEYRYDTRAMRTLEGAFEELMAQDLER